MYRMYSLNPNKCFRARIKKNDRLSDLEEENKQLKQEIKALKVSIQRFESVLSADDS